MSFLLFVPANAFFHSNCIGTSSLRWTCRSPSSMGLKTPAESKSIIVSWMKGSPSLQLYLDNPKRFFQRATARGFPKKRQEPLRRQLFEHISEHSTHLQDAKNLVDMLRVMELSLIHISEPTRPY